MKEMFLTKEGTLTESIKHVYVSEDKEYYHTNASIVKIYEDFKIKDFDNLVPETYKYKELKFGYPEINGYDKIITYSCSQNSDLYIEFDIIENFDFNNIKPKFSTFCRTSELYIYIKESELDYYL